jgi:hypothetical protein
MLDAFKKTQPDNITAVDLPLELDELTLQLKQDKKGYYLIIADELIYDLGLDTNYTGKLRQLIEVFQKNKENSLFEISWEESIDNDIEEEEAENKIYIANHPFESGNVWSIQPV